MGNIAHFFRDLAALGELQGMLFLVDAGDDVRQARKGLALIAVFAAVGLSCVPLGLAGVAVVASETTRLTLGQSLLVVTGVGLPIAGAGIYVAVQWLNPARGWLQRSRAEWKCNLAWMKETLKHLGDGPHDPCAVPPGKMRR